MQSSKSTPTRIRKRKHADNLSSEKSIPWNGKQKASTYTNRKANKKGREVVEKDQLRECSPDSITKPLTIGRASDRRTKTIPQAIRLPADGHQARQLPS